MRLSTSRDSQHGAAALLILVVLIGSGGLALVTVVQSASMLDMAEDRARVLGRSREALLAYAVSYIDLYGPRGAGPGHLPCPDTDTDAEKDWRRDGPNPPCGGTSAASGRLPRHISLPGRRYNFHSEPDQRLWYVVSSGFINNPVNRVVNPASRGTLQVNGVDDIVAVIIDPGDGVSGRLRRLESLDSRFAADDADADAGAGASASASASAGAGAGAGAGIDVAAILSAAGVPPDDARLTTIGMDSLRQAMVRRVALWLRERYTTAALTRCEANTAASTCRPYAQPCGDNSRLLWLIDDSLYCNSDPSTVPVTPRAAVSRGPKVLQSDEAAGTDMVDLSGALMEEVPLEAHWYMRNGWPAHVQLTVTPACETLALEACRFRVGRSEPGEPPVHIELVPMEQPGS